METKVENKQSVVIRFAGDSGDGMQIVGVQFTNASAMFGNDVYTFPDYPAEIRAPAGTLAGVSGFQIRFAEHLVHTAGDELDVLVAMNPAALKANVAELKQDGMIIVNEDAFTKNNLRKALCESDPREDACLDQHQLISVAITTQTLNVVEGLGLKHSEASKCKNMYALGIVCWLYERDLTYCLEWISQKFKDKQNIAKANVLALKAGYLFAEQSELFKQHRVQKATLQSGWYRQITGNEALCLGLLCASERINRECFVSGYPITPASTILHQMASYQQYQVTTLQAEDEIAAVCAAIGAAYGGMLAMTCTSGPGFDLKTEGLGLAVMAEMPLLVVDVQRAGPATGMPTKGEQSDLLAAVYGRHGECPIPVFAPATPAECFDIIFFAAQVAVKYMIPVIILSDAFLANSAEPWLIPEVDKLAQLTQQELTASRSDDTLARPWVTPGMKDQMFRVGGIEKDFITGDVSYEPLNHQRMVQLRAEKVKRLQRDLPSFEIIGESSGDILVLSWGSTYGSVLTAVLRLQEEGHSISLLHCRYLFPLPEGLETALKGFNKVFMPELNNGQFSKLIRDLTLCDVIEYHKVQGKPFLVSELYDKLLKLMG